MNSTHLLAELRRRAIALWVEDGALRFRAPKGALTAELRAEIKSHRDHLLELLAATDRVVPLERIPHRGRGPLSFGQEQLWFLDQLNPGTIAYTAPSTIRIRGVLDVEALRRALSEIVQRHDTLRSTFASTDGKPEVHVATATNIPLDVVSLEELPATDRLAEALRRAELDARTPFDLARGPLLRTKLYSLAPDDHVFYVATHHAVWDAWSWMVFFRELTELYQAFRDGSPSPLAALEIGYLDYACWQRRRLESGALDAQLDYWRGSLAGLPTLELPTDRPHPSRNTLDGAAVQVELPAELSAELQALSQSEGLSLYQLLLTSWFVVLGNQTGSTDIPVGSPVSGRPHHQLQGLIGLFVNWVVLRADLSGNPTFRELAARVRSLTLEAMAHEDVPFDRVVEALQPKRLPGRNPLFQVLFNFLDSTGVGDVNTSLQLEPIDAESRFELDSARFDLTLVCNRRGDDIALQLQYKTALFDAATAQRTLDQFATLLRRVVADPGLRLAQLGSATAAPAPEHPAPMPAASSAADYDLMAMLDAAFDRFSDHTALLGVDRAITFAELDRASNRIANALLASDFPHGGIAVAAVRDRLQMIAVMLGIWRAGGVFVPVDPDGPEQRVRRILTEVDPGAIIAETADAEGLWRWAPTPPAARICFAPADSSDWSSATLQPGGTCVGDFEAGRTTVGVDGGGMSYIYYTSGSTGQPKGIAGTLRGLAHFVDWEIETFGVLPGTRVSQLTVPTFDAFFRDVLVPLCAGGTVCVPPNTQHLDPRELLHWVDECGIQLIHCVPSLFASLTAVAHDPQSLQTLGHVLMSGEVLATDLVRDWMRVFGTRIQLVNFYGPTETTMIKMYHVVTPADVERGFVPIGKPMKGCRVVLLDQEGNVRIHGTVGELYIRTPFMTLGYYKNDELTESAFVQNPLSDKPGDLVYRTGDLARVLDDGSLQFLGRKDSQVKIRGVRVELEEIEAALREYPGVAEAGVTAREDATGETQLLAYVVAPDDPVDPDAIRSFLAQRLPAQMVPVTCVPLDALPRRPNGKLDRNALPDPGHWQGAAAAAYVEPQSKSERVVARVWADILGLGQVGRDDDFFDLGGHSLRAIQVAVRLRDVLSVDVPLQALFENRSLTALASYLDGLAASTPAAPPLRPIDSGEPAPLSFAQHRLWVLEQLDPGSFAYVMSSAVRLHGHLDVAALQRALDEIVQRHTVLRTVIHTRNGEPVQEVVDATPFPLEIIDIQDIASDQREQRVRELFTERGRRPFDFEGGMFVRGTLIRLDQNDHALACNMHHIVGDAWSQGVFFGELTALYAAELEGHPAPLAALPVQYGDYAQWQRQWVTGELLENQLSYWREQLAGMPPSLDLPTDRPRPPVIDYDGAVRSFVVSRGTSEALQDLCKAAGVTTFVASVAILKVLLMRYSGQTDIVIGTPVANRDRREIEDLIGFFINTLVLRTDLGGDPTFTELLARVSDTAMAAFAHQDVPFEELVVAIQPERSLNRNPLFQVSFTFHHAPFAPQHLPGLTLARQDFGVEASRFDLECHIGDADGALAGAMRYSTRLFDAATIDQMIAHYRALLAAVVASPDARLSELSILDDRQRRQLLVEWTDTARSWPNARPVHEQIAAQAATTPDAVALVFEGAELSYRAMDRRANQLAHRLRSLGVTTDTPVALLLERSLDMVISILAILKAGGAYLPLSVEDPQARLALILEETRPAVVIAQHHRARELPATAATLLCIEEIAGELALAPDDAPAVEVPWDSLAYTIYTSGSTGVPKGTMNTHRGIANRLLWMQDAFRLTAADRVLQKTPYNFDVSVWEFLWPLMTGAQLVIARPGGHRDPTYIADTIRAQGVTTMHFVPSMLRAFLEVADFDQLPDLRRVICSGEALSADLREQFVSRTDIELHNLYGPTEAAIDVTACRCDTLPDGAAVPIGKPIANVTTYVLDDNLQPLPVGVPGELFIGGVQLARGYFRRPGLTAARFLPDPFCSEHGGRLYRTGDRVRLRADGNLEFLGRYDDQVKVRGYRIELGEIEAVLRQHAGVSEAVAAVVEHSSGDRRLVGYVVPAGGKPPEDLHCWARERLPEYMVPGVLVVLEQIPLTSTGKVNRRALPAPQDSTAVYRVGSGAFTAPRTATEERLTELWRQTLRRDRVGVHDNFFELGGDSILAIRVVAAANDLGLRLTPRQLFEHQTIANLATVVGARPAVRAEQGMVTGEFPLTPIQHWLFERQLADPQHFNLGMLFTVRTPLAPARCRRAVRTLLEHHDILRARYFYDGAEWHQRIVAAGDDVPFATIDLARVPADRQGAALEAEAGALQASLDLAGGPLIRVALFEMGAAAPQRLLVAVHHLVVDGVSLRILSDDLQLLCAGEDAKLPAKTSSFAAWSRWLAQHATAAVFTAHRQFWLDQAWHEASDLPLDHPAGDNTIATTSVVTGELSEAETQALLTAVPAAYNTQINDVLLTAVVLALAPWTGSSTVLLDLEGHGREDLDDELDVSRTFGWFTALYPVLLHVGGAADTTAGLDTALKSVKEQLRALSDRAISFGLLRYLGDDASRAALAALPAPQVSFNYLGQFDDLIDDTSLFGPANESMGLAHSPRNQRAHLLDVLGSVAGGKLRVGWVYSEAIHENRQIEAISARFLAALRRIIDHCQRPDARGFTPSDFPHADLTQRRLDAITARFGPAQIEDLLALSPMQQGLMFHSLSEAATGVYIEHVRFPMENADVAAFRGAWQAIVDRHSILRTSILDAGTDGALQVVHRSVAIPVAEHDCRDMTPAAQQDWITAFLAEDARRGFDLAKPPLLRLTLIRLSDEHYEAVWSQHHIILDGWSVPVVAADFVRFYSALHSGREIAFEPSPPYRDYIGWLRRQDLPAAEDYWRRKLAGFDTPTVVGGKPPATSDDKRAPDYASRELEITPDLLSRLQALATDTQVTLNTVMLGGWSLLLSHYAGEDDVVFGTTVSGRPAELRGVESMVGLLINTLPVRVTIDDAAVAPWLRQLQAQHLEQQEFQYSPLWMVQQWSDVPAGTPLFETLYVFENYPSVAAQPGERRREAQLKQERTGYPLALCINPRVGLVARLNYDRNAFSDEMIDRMLGQFENLLDGMASTPQARVLDLPMLAATEREQLLVEWNDTATSLPAAGTVPEWFEAVVARTPTAPAVVDPSETVTYDELNRRANRLAHSLLAMELPRNSLVGLCADRSTAMVTGMLGILKAGAAYVPLDPSYPHDRLAFMLADADIAALVTQRQLAHRLPDHDTRVLYLEADARGPAENPAHPGSGDDLCYAIYTSGSTGRPKGALLQHRGLCNVAAQQQRAFEVGPGSRVLQFASLSFDAATFETVMALLSGATLYLASRDTLRPGPDLLDYLRRQQISVVTLPPAALAATPFTDLPALRTITVAGEACPLELVKTWAPGRRFFNLYGPTEATIWSTAAELHAGVPAVHIGRPIGNVTAYVLDRHDRPVPMGTAGELCIGGVGVGLGYHRQAELTAARFTASPFGSGRLYRTGDLARYLADGNLEFLGRLDHQVKLRGYRIELGEIDAVLTQHAAVQSSLTVLDDGNGGDPRLVTYVVPDMASAAAAVRSREQESNDDHIQHWQDLYDDTYAVATTTDPTFNISGWNSSFTGEPIPAEEMREWVDRTAARILSGQPQRVLEIGCGSGLLLFRVAPHSRRYVGTDFSQQALDYIAANLDHIDASSCEIELQQCRADMLLPEYAGQFDTVILNSVAQYFPDADYLARVIETAVALLDRGGRIFVGDVRSLPLLEAFHEAVQLAQAGGDLNPEQLRTRIHRAVQQDQELVVDPAFFDAIGARVPRITHVQQQPKRGRYRNELSRFRYDVILHVDGEEGETSDVTAWQDWRGDHLSLEAVRSQLECGADECAIRGVANARTSESDDAVEPQDLWDLGDELGYRVDASLGAGRADGSFEAVFRRTGSARPRFPAISPEADRPLGSHANQPLRGRLIRGLVPELREIAKQRLPDYMIPAAFVVLDRLPLTPSGKVDRRALPSPDGTTADLPFEPPRNDAETAMAAIWAEILQLDRVGIHQNFFDLGGHSLNVTQVAARVREQFGQEIAIREVFEAPTVAELTERMAATQATGVELPPIVPVRRDAPLPLSSAQKRLWLIEQMNPQSGAYTYALAIDLLGELDTAALSRSLREIVNRHETLRTTFAMGDSEPVQRIAPPPDTVLPTEDLRSLPVAERTAAAAALLETERSTPFDLEQGPLLRCRLLQLADDQHRLLLALHHIVTDGWSNGVFARELGTLYAAFHEHRESPLPPLAVQYADFAAWQNRWFEQSVLETMLEYWRQKLAEAPTLELPTDRLRPPVETFDGAAASVDIEATIARGLDDLGRSEQATLFMTVLAAFSVLLQRYSDQDDIVVGAPIAGRSQRSLEDLIGFFINNLVLRTDLSGDPTFRELLRRVRSETLDAYAHQDIPFEYLVERLQVGRDPSRHPLFQVALAVQNAPQEQLHLPGLRLQPVAGDASATARFDLEVHIGERPKGLAVTFIFNTNLFDAETIDRMLGHFQNLLAAIAGDPDQRLSALPMLAQRERQRLLYEWNRTAAGPSDGRPVHELVAARAELTPAAVAVTYEETQLTYDELNRRANQLAHELIELTAGRGQVIGVCLDRNSSLPVVLLAIAKSGAAYLPIDPTLPGERIQFMIEDAGATVVVTTSQLAPDLPLATTLCLDRDHSRIAARSGEDPDVPARPGDLAYLIYTSGSTGQPKGVEVSHGNLVNFLTSMRREPGMTAADRLLSVTTMSFDIAGLELFLPLITGARVEIAPRSISSDGLQLRQRLDRGDITVMQATPATWQLLLEAGWAGGRGLRLLCGGEALPAPLGRQLLDRGSELWNLYGPTETTIWSAVERVTSAGNTANVPIGHAIANTQLYVLDRRGEPVAIGIPGELYIGGDGVARGYHNRPALTARQFVPDEFGSTSGGRLYATGDRVRRLPDGRLEFIERIDNQVKLRGHRIELGEIESVAPTHPAVRHAIAMVREDQPGDRRLVLYVVPSQTPPEPLELRRHLAGRLPDYMLPAAIVVLDALPLNTSGKIDRSALPAPETVATAAPKELTTEMEVLLAATWSEVLGVEQIGALDNFFDLGGHSLLAVRAMSMMQEKTGVRVDFLEFMVGTLGQIAQSYESTTPAPRREGWLGRARSAFSRLAQRRK